MVPSARLTDRKTMGEGKHLRFSVESGDPGRLSRTQSHERYFLPRWTRPVSPPRWREIISETGDVQDINRRFVQFGKK